MRFGPFAIDETRWQLSRGAVAVDLSPRLVEILGYLAARPGALVTRDELLDRFWPDVHVGDNTLTRAIADIRKAIGDDTSHPEYIQTVARRGYRFIAAPAAGASEADADPFLSWVRGRASLETLDPAALPEACAAFARAAGALPEQAAPHVGLANALLLTYERTRATSAPDREALARAEAAARRGVALDGRLAEGWATLAHVLVSAGRADEAMAAARHAVALEPASWRHQYRLALAAWGEERLAAVERARGAYPDCGPALLLGAMVHIARRAWEPARLSAEAGAALQAAQGEGARLPAAGLCWVRGLVSYATGHTDRALEDFAREAGGSGARHLYAREAAVNALVSTAFARLHAGDAPGAGAAARAALEILPGHGRAALARALAEGAAATLETGASAGNGGEATLLRAATLAWSGDVAQACTLLASWLDAAPPGPAGWSLPADPIFAPLQREPAFAPVLARLAARAS